MKIHEIYYSIQGESTFTGLPCIFVRTSGCHLRCTYCDTRHAYYAGSEMSLDDIVTEIQQFPANLVEITGGEPLLQPEINELATALLNYGYTVLCETSGAVDIDKIDQRVHRIVDIKTPGSGEVERNDWENLKRLTKRDEVKFVICDRNDFDWAVHIYHYYQLAQHTVLFSPSFAEMKNETLVNWILEAHIPVRFQVQLHKYVWHPETQGV